MYRLLKTPINEILMMKSFYTLHNHNYFTGRLVNYSSASKTTKGIFQLSERQTVEDHARVLFPK